jgi:hypothetical protein
VKAPADVPALARWRGDTPACERRIHSAAEIDAAVEAMDDLLRAPASSGASS